MANRVRLELLSMTTLMFTCESGGRNLRQNRITWCEGYVWADAVIRNEAIPVLVFPHHTVSCYPIENRLQ